MNVRYIWELIRNPVRSETKKKLDEVWHGLDPRFRTEQQMLGRHEEGCGATIGVMPRCDFACQCCYLGREANRIPHLPVDAIKDQMRLLRRQLGVWGNLQLTDGEVTLRDTDELIELLRFAHEIELVPMLMTHGDSFRRRPELLERLIVQGGLAEISLHIDITQRGRLGHGYKNAKSELELMPLRAEFASMIRDIRKRTRKSLRVASTVTVVPDNMGEVSDIVSWYQENADVFRLVSFQPIASVGRTNRKIDNVRNQTVWNYIASGLNYGNAESCLSAHQWWLGHSECSRFIMGLVTHEKGLAPRFHPLSIAGGDESDHRVLSYFYKKWGGITFRADNGLEKLCRSLGMFLQAPLFFLNELPRYVWTWFHRLAPNQPWKVPLQILRRQLHIHRFTVVTHHFMDLNQINTPLGRERLEHCAFVVPIDGNFESMCEVNASGIRDRFYTDISQSQKN